MAQQSVTADKKCAKRGALYEPFRAAIELPSGTHTTYPDVQISRGSSFRSSLRAGSTPLSGRVSRAQASAAMFCRPGSSTSFEQILLITLKFY
jgi:hypothetical protein